MIEISSLRERYVSQKMPGVVALLDALCTEKGQTVRRIGSTTVGLVSLDKNQYKTEDEIAAAVFSLPSIFIGGGGQTPLESLEELLPFAERHDLPGRKVFDDLCHDLAALLTGNKSIALKSVGSISISYY